MSIRLVRSCFPARLRACGIRESNSHDTVSTPKGLSLLFPVEGLLPASRDTLGAARMVLSILATYAGESHSAYPSVGTLAVLANVSERQVQLDLRKLVKSGELIVVRKGGGRNRPMEYQITLKTCSPFELSEKVKSMKGVLTERQMRGRVLRGRANDPTSWPGRRTLS